MEYRVKANDLFTTLTAWDELIRSRGRIHLDACGGTALTLLGYKESTKDVDFLVPEKMEYERLIHFLEQAGYGQSTGCGWKRPSEAIVYDLYPGKAVYTTELLNSPLGTNRNKKIREWKKIYLGVLNPIDLIITKMFRGTPVDFDDCLALFQKEKVDLNKLGKRYKETAKYDVSEDRVLKNYEKLLEQIKNLK